MRTERTARLAQFPGGGIAMSRPRMRDDLPPRKSENRKRRLDPEATPEQVHARFLNIRYGGSSKHKWHPHLFGLEPYRGERGDATLCDAHARFQPEDMQRVPDLLVRARRAALIGTLIWTVDDNGWIYELECTNQVQNEHHGYPLRGGDATAEVVFHQFRQWANIHGTAADMEAARACERRYGFKV